MKRIIQTGLHFAAKNSPHILTVCGAVGVVSTAVLAVKATPKALDEIKHQNDHGAIELTKKEIVQATWKFYIPTAIVGGASIACIIGANTIHAGRVTALASAYSIVDKAMTEYQDKVVETLGEKKEKTIRDAVAADQLNKAPLSQNIVYVTGKGDTLCYDVMSGRYFRSDMEALKRAENSVNHELFNGVWVSLNTLYREIGLDEIKIGEILGWNTNNMIELNFSSQLAEDGTPCLVLDYRHDPKHGYWDVNA